MDTISGLNNGQFFWLMIAVFGSIVIVVAIISEYLTARLKARVKVEQTRAREETRREIAAYVAEGSVTAEEGAALIAAGGDSVEKLKSTVSEWLGKARASCEDACGNDGSSRKAGREAARQV